MSGIIYTDMEGYYMYLPAIFIYHGFEQVPILTTAQFSKYPGTDKVFTKYTYGVALMQAPFFTLTHIWQHMFYTSQATGYTLPYALTVIFAACFYALMGLLLLYFLLRRSFGTYISLITCLLIFTGTNLYYYTLCQPGMSHVYSFFLFAAFTYLTPAILSGASVGRWLLYGFIAGLILIIRPTNILLLLYPLAYGCFTRSIFLERLLFFAKHALHIALTACVAFLVFIPQLVYWYYISGSLVIYSYDQEGFTHWRAPHIWAVLFDVQNGWLLYTPLMLVALAGLALLWRRRIPPAVPTVILLPIATYIFASWWAWWFGGAFGHRCYVEYYTLLSFGLAAALSYAATHRYARLAVAAFVLFCVFYNLRLTYLYQAPWDGPGWTWHQFSLVLRRLI